MVFRTIFLRVKHCNGDDEVYERSFVIEKSVLFKAEALNDYAICDLRTGEKFYLLDIGSEEDWVGLKSTFTNVGL